MICKKSLALEPSTWFGPPVFFFHHETECGTPLWPATAGNTEMSGQQSWTKPYIYGRLRRTGTRGQPISTTPRRCALRGDIYYCARDLYACRLTECSHRDVSAWVELPLGKSLVPLESLTTSPWNSYGILQSVAPRRCGVLLLV